MLTPEHFNKQIAAAKESIAVDEALTEEQFLTLLLAQLMEEESNELKARSARG